MLLKTLPDSYKAFIIVITETKDDTKSSDFKKALLSYEESENCRLSYASSSVNDNVINVRAKHNLSKSFKCLACGSYGHKKPDCPNNVSNKPKNRWCDTCENASHDTSN